MKIVIFKELEPLPFSKLKEEITIYNDDKIYKLIDELKKYKFIKKREDYSFDELENLLFEENFETTEKNESKDIYFFKYVGIITILEVCFIIYPKYISNEDLKKDEDNSSYLYLKQLLAVIRKYNSNNEQEQINSKDEKGNFSPLALALEMIEDYYENGLYFNEKVIIEENGNGEINWDKTINENTAYFVKNTPFYLEFFVQTRVLNEQDFFRRLHACILSTCSFSFKKIFKILNIPELNLSIENIENFGSEEYILYKLNQELSQQYITKKQKTLNLLKEYIERKNSYNIDNEISFIGTSSFNLVWEKVCKTTLDKSNDTHKLRAKIYQSLWNLNGKQESSAKTLEPDILVLEKDNKNLTIYDAKYYNIYKNKPGISDITKQFLYGEIFRKLGYNLINNSFLFPTNNIEDREIGDVKFKLFENSKINLILKSAPKLYEEYLKL